MATIYEVVFGAFVEASEQLEGLPAAAAPLVEHDAWGLLKELRSSDAGYGAGVAYQDTIAIPSGGSVQIDLTALAGIEQTEDAAGKYLRVAAFQADAENADEVEVTGAGTDGYGDFASGETLTLGAGMLEYRHVRDAAAVASDEKYLTVTGTEGDEVVVVLALF